MIRSIYDMALLQGKSYEWLDYLSNEIGGRLSGSLEAERAVKYTESELNKLGLDKVWLQPVMVPKWTRGTKEYAYIETAPGISTTTDVCALGGSVPTPAIGLKAEVIEVQGLEDLERYKLSNSDYIEIMIVDTGVNQDSMAIININDELELIILS
mgnify:CR=1 FL=1